MQLKISSGAKKGAKIQVPEGIEPVKNIVKLAIFSVLGDKTKRANCLDLFSGSGNLGLEALSLGAEKCTFVDESQESINCIKKNIQKLDYVNKSKIVKSKADQFLNHTPTKYDVVFLDPPYKQTIDNITKKLLNCLNDGGIIIYLHSKDYKYNWGVGVEVKSKKYGRTSVDLVKIIK